MWIETKSTLISVTLQINTEYSQNIFTHMMMENVVFSAKKKVSKLKIKLQKVAKQSC